MENNFKVGDRVLFKWDGVDRHGIEEDILRGLNGKIFTLNRERNRIWYVDESNYNFLESWLKPITHLHTEKSVENNFKVGDRVLFKWDGGENYFIPVGELQELDGKEVIVKRVGNVNYEIEGSRWTFHESWLKPIEEESGNIEIAIASKEIKYGLNGQHIYDNAKYDDMDEE